MGNPKLIFHNSDNSFNSLKYSENESLAHVTMYGSYIILEFHKMLPTLGIPTVSPTVP